MTGGKSLKRAWSAEEIERRLMGLRRRRDPIQRLRLMRFKRILREMEDGEAEAEAGCRA